MRVEHPTSAVNVRALYVIGPAPVRLEAKDPIRVRGGSGVGGGDWGHDSGEIWRGMFHVEQ
jgi:hypothetical protein